MCWEDPEAAERNPKKEKGGKGGMKLNTKSEFVNIELTIHVTPANKEAVKRAIETLALWEAIGPYTKTDILRRIKEVED